MSKQLNLDTDNFDAVSYESWKEKITKDLKGKPFDGLSYEIEPGIEIHAAQHGDLIDAKQPLVFPSPWKIGEAFDIKAGQEAATNSLLLEGLQGGVETVFLDLLGDDDPDFDLVMQDVYLDMIHIICRGTMKQLSAARVYFYDKPCAVNFIKCQDKTDLPSEQIAAALHSLTDQLELGYSTQECAAIVSINSEILTMTATLRAIHRLWPLVCQGFEVEPTPLHIIGLLSTNADASEKHTEMIRAATKSISAIIGGCSDVIARPSQGHQDERFARRIARNALHILREESFVGEVNDPSAGSYYIEALTDKLAKKAWATFQAQEAARV